MVGVPASIMGQEAGGQSWRAAREICFERKQQSQRGAGCLGVKNLECVSKGCLPVPMYGSLIPDKHFI